MDLHEFDKCKEQQKENLLLLFNGASRNNPGEAGVGGIPLDIGGNQIASYAWGLGEVSNNMVDAYFLWKGLDINKGEGLKSIIILGDSMLVIKAMRSSDDPTNKDLSTLIVIIHKSLGYFENINFFHISRELNGIANH
jgi:ribonuclease HI